MSVLTSDHLNNWSPVNHFRELDSIPPPWLSQDEDVFPGVKWKLQERNGISLVVIPLSFNLSLKPGNVPLDLKTTLAKYSLTIAAQWESLLPKIREGERILVVEIVEYIEQVIPAWC